MAENGEIVIGPGCEVVMRYTLSLEDGTVVETTTGYEPMRFSLGDGTLIDGLESVLYGLKAGDKQCVSIEPRDGFGFADVGNIHVMPRSEFADDILLEEGLIIGFSTPAGEQVPGTIVAVEEDQVQVDFNHPLAGRTVIFDVEILEVNPPPVH